MIIICQKCDSRLQLDEAKVPARSFVVRCPNCNSSIDAESSVASPEQSAVNIGGSPASEGHRFEQPNPAPLFEPAHKAQASGSDISADRLAELLAGLINQPTASRKTASARPSWDPRKVLLCVPEDYRESLARSLVENDYQVFVANDTRQAVDRMRENLLDMVLLDSRFDPAEQGQVFVTREVSVLRPAQRRRLFFVLLSPSLRSMDSHAAFLNNVNAIVNVNEMADLPKMLEHLMRAYNELYKEFNQVLGMPAL